MKTFEIDKLTDKMSVKRDKDANAHELVVEFAFDEVGHGQVEELLLAALKVKYATRARKLPEAELGRLAEMGKVEVDVAGLFVREARVVDPVKVAKTCSDEQARLLLKELQERFGLE